jgi:hypothetical protein
MIIWNREGVYFEKKCGVQEAAMSTDPTLREREDEAVAGRL